MSNGLRILKDVYKSYNGKKRFVRIALEEGKPDDENYKIFPITSAEARNAISLNDIHNILDDTSLDFIMERIEEVLDRQGKIIEHRSEILNQIKDKKNKNVTEMIEIIIKIPKVR